MPSLIQNPRRDLICIINEYKTFNYARKKNECGLYCGWVKQQECLLQTSGFYGIIYTDVKFSNFMVEKFYEQVLKFEQ